MKEIIKKQMMAALATLNQCIENCSDVEWEKPHGDAVFSQVLFHTLFYLDYYLSSKHEFKLQQFHKENVSIFREYEEFEYKKAEQIYTRGEIRTYFNFCYKRIDEYFAKLEDNDLLAESGHNKMKNMELLIYGIRHIQHHAAQLGLRIQQVTGKELDWVSSG
jgi:hypothetical protein